MRRPAPRLGKQLFIFCPLDTADPLDADQPLSEGVRTHLPPTRFAESMKSLTFQHHAASSRVAGSCPTVKCTLRVAGKGYIISTIEGNVVSSGRSETPVDEKRQALEFVLQSRTLRRCDQLKKMLRFVCEAEIEGRATDLNEYLIGVEALGRPTSYNPVEDSTVRTRAYELRNKLGKFYSIEAPDAPIRIEIERGAYIPRFVRRQEMHISSSATAPVLPPEPVSRGGWKWRERALTATGCVVLALVAYGLLRPSRGSIVTRGEGWTPELEAFWKPFLADDAPLLLTYQSRLFLLAPPLELMVRNYRTNSMSDVPQSPALQEFQKQMGVANFVETRNYADFGAVNSVFLLMRTVGKRQAQISLKRSDDLDWTDIFNDNVIFVGGLAAAVPRLERVLESGDFVEDALAISNVRPKAGEPRNYPVAHLNSKGANDGIKYALLSRFPGPRRGHYIMILGSAHSELPWALAEYITNPLSMRELMQHLKLPSGELPDAFQVVLKVTLQSQVPVRVEYATHHIVASPEFPYEPLSPKN